LSLAVIINPISGTGGRPDAARRRAEFARAALEQHALVGTVSVSDYPGHARVLARSALAAGARLIVAWGGDGTVNEVGAELIHRPVALGVIPSGSGNGLARELRIPFDPAAAFAIAARGRERPIDGGEIDGRSFFNIAGLGLDARIAHEFAADGLVRRGFRRYLEIGARELFAYTPDEHTITADGVSMRSRALLIALANGRQYGNGATIAPLARLDDGRLDVVVVASRAPLRALLEVPFVFAGRVGRLAGVTMTTAQRVEITSGRPVVYHCDGEPFVGGAAIRARVLPAALTVRCP
jgi:YegS/Rv2252/BmrU family lipid kinase